MTDLEGQQLLGFQFDRRFMADHVGQIMDDPRIALVEIVANAYDAGAKRVLVRWPDSVGQQFAVSDDGTGMTEEQFDRRWKTWSFNRLTEADLGPNVQFPEGVRARDRKAFGRNGKGRHGGFCFARQYEVETWRDGKQLRAEVRQADEGPLPYTVNIVFRDSKQGHGTAVRAVVEKNHITTDEVIQLLAAKFMVDPDFTIQVNARVLELADIKSLDTKHLQIGSFGSLTIHRIAASSVDRTAHLRGVSWWSRRRMVGQPSWDFLVGEGSYLDGRTNDAKRHSFIIEADFLQNDVKHDWSDFHANERTNLAKSMAHGFIAEEVNGLVSETRKLRKREALADHAAALGQLTPLSRAVVGQFVDDVQARCPTLSPKDLSATVEVFAKFEAAQSGYGLLQRLLECSPDDIDKWNQLMLEWTASNAKLVLGELQKRLKLIEELEVVMRTNGADELHEIQPLFERGLWIFGPEYEAIDFQSNRRMSTVIRNYFGNKEAAGSKRRPDFVITADSSIGAYSANDYDDGGEVRGYRKVLIVELKTTGLTLTQHEIDQARNYGKELVRTRTVDVGTQIVAIVLGTTIEPFLTENVAGNVVARPMTYDVVLKKAHARTFHLHRRMSEIAPVQVDSDAEHVVRESCPSDLYEA